MHGVTVTIKNVDLHSVGWMETTSLTLCSVACSSGETRTPAAARFQSIWNFTAFYCLTTAGAKSLLNALAAREVSELKRRVWCVQPNQSLALQRTS